jgi:cation diffusion facilitator CzcD-associated flavoprotein CzcO
LIKSDHEITDITFDQTHRQWRLTTNHGEFFAKCVILATGGLAEAKMPDIPGLGDFTGPVMHTARLDDSIELSGQRVGIIGTGASSIQVVPQIAPLVASLDVFQRTPSLVLPHQGHPALERIGAMS